MSGVELALALCLTAAAGPPEAPASEAPAIEEVSATRPARSVRLLAQAGAGLAAVGVAFAIYLGATSSQSYVGFLAGFIGATVAAAVLGPLAVHLVGRALGGGGGPGWTALGAVLGLVAGVLVGLPLATLPSQAYLTGLGVLWAAPAAGALIANAASSPAVRPVVTLIPGGAVAGVAGGF